ncbi:Protein kinase superfamily protein [Perilla frutescens var. hirtella]|uniref:non-specific serine/threonine protein kinase n=1 Tax=Perilla frutescens var. hirtella TaxID=608512 RepID=A0AAD4J3X5_PERFH|nr:Protein kinase superfamily protein [Perilla frutescens var. hirtella]KAH6815628.1 Protein kinase superfamily protein [Perilla frutescens var. frutescens]KAH6826745.1 Protein kinase superfamily protein [Perilla frutescens var. hirtella]
MPFGLVSAWNKRRRSKSEDHINPWVYKPVEHWQIDYKGPPAKRRSASAVYTLKEMEEATCSFSDENLLGKGGFGRVYKATLRSGEVVAIKKMELPPFKAAEGEREFRVEVDILSRLDHPNLVNLIGYCADGKQRFLVYEYMHKGNLQDHLNGIGEVKMDWPSRLRVAIGAARGLAYLHSGSDVGIPIVHRDFKSTNILLDGNLEAKISDFGLAKLMPEGQETCVTTATVLGTFGYFDPEYTLTGKLTLQSDVYAFGVVLLELLTGRRAVDLSQGPNDQNLVLQVRHILNDKKKLKRVIDPEMVRSSYTMESIAMFANLASRCIRIDSQERPSMTECVKELQLILHINSKGLGMTMHALRML